AAAKLSAGAAGLPERQQLPAAAGLSAGTAAGLRRIRQLRPAAAELGRLWQLRPAAPAAGLPAGRLLAAAEHDLHADRRRPVPGISPRQSPAGRRSPLRDNPIAC